MVEEKTWKEFRQTGLILIINQILHIFGWALVFEIEEKTGHITKMYPARVKFRGFDNSSVDSAYKKVGKYLKNNSQELYDEVYK